MKLICKKQAPVIVFSGPSGTAKTTLIEKLTAFLVKRDLTVKILDSPGRSYFKNRLDDIREDAESYFSAQISIATNLNEAYKSIDLDAKDTIYILDRSLVDTAMYTSLYIDAKKLTDFEVCVYEDFKTTLLSDIAWFQCIYKPITFLTAPLNIKNDDGIRPKNLKIAQKREYKHIKKILNSLNINYYAISKDDFEILPEIIYNKIINLI